MVHVWLAVWLALAGVFLLSAVAKVRAFDNAAAMCTALLRRVGLPQVHWGHAAAGLLVVVEAATGAALLIGGTLAVPALVVAGLLLSAFTIVAVLSARNVVDLRCACFGQAVARLGWRHVWRDLALLAGVVVGLAAAPVDVPAQWNLWGVVVAVAAAAMATMLAAFYDDIVDVVTG